MRFTRVVSLTVFAAVLGSAAAYASPNLVQNGDFSSTNSVNANTQIGYSTYGQFVTGWTEYSGAGSNGYGIWFSSPYDSSHTNTIGQYSYTGNEKLYSTVTPSPNGGGAFVGLDGAVGEAQAGIKQTISGLTVGQMYTLTFDWAAGQLQSRSGSTATHLTVSLDGDSFNTAAENADQNFNGWYSPTHTFIATSTSEVLSFLAVGSAGSLPPMGLLDNVSLTAVPEPATLALIGSLLATVGVIRRRRA